MKKGKQKMNKKVICLGGQGDPSSIGKAIVDANRRADDEWEFVGFLNDRIKVGTILEGFPILGRLDQAQTFVDKGYYFINGIYRIDGNKSRIALFESLAIPESRLATFVHPTAYVAPNVVFGPGCVVMPNVCISPEVTFGKCCIVLQAATVGHNNEVSDYCHISAQACLGAYLRIGKGCHIGMNSTIRENITIGDYSTLGMGSVLHKNIGEDEIWAGFPARFIRRPHDD